MGSDNPLIQNSFLGSKWFNPEYLFDQGIAFFQRLSEYTFNNGPAALPYFDSILFFLTLFFITIISYSSIRVLEIRIKEKRHLRHELEEYAHYQAELEKQARKGEEISHNPRWIKTISYLFSQHASDWKLAVIEADSLLEDLMTQLGFKGENLGEKLKDATQERFKSLSLAWEVHTIRNKIAHEGASFAFSQHEAKRVIAIYEAIFRQYGHI